jgi:uncharacterized surface protein with fasciclin (FAS1) repeats
MRLLSQPLPLQAEGELEMSTRTSGGERDLLFALERSGRFRSFLHLLRKAELSTELRGDGPWTVFAPTDAAFAALDLENIELLLSTPELLIDVAEHHVVHGRWTSSALTTLRQVHTLQGESLTARLRAGQTFVGEATLERADILCRNGVLHVVDTVLVPTYGLRGAPAAGRRFRKFHYDLHGFPIALARSGSPCDPASVEAD